MSEQCEKFSAAVALGLLVPAPILGVAAGLWLWPGEGLGEAVWMAAKVWLVGLPVVWLMLVDRRRPRLPRLRREGMGLGLVSGLVIAAVIGGAYLAVGERWIDLEPVRQRAAEAGLDVWWRYLALALYATFINALLEEYVWRWFVFTRWEKVVRSGRLAVVLSAACFTLHHILALAAFFDPVIVALGSLGVFLGGVIWSAIYLHSRNIYAPYLSHIFADVAVFGIGAWLIFGS
ncbi:MAG: CPBP family intramembrane metalloprotease [Phycisphaeraceae bacterium]|nr:CPBP family intramembrane metalloprotease [Phycisphaeraceae bacterium]